MLTVVVVVILAAILIADFVTFDQLVKLEYRSYRKNWEADGQPHGFFWVPAEAKRLGGLAVSLRSSISSNLCSYTWLFSTPSWVKGDEEATHLLYRLRILTIIWNAAILLIMLYQFVL